MVTTMSEKYFTELSGSFGNPSCDYKVENGVIVEVIYDETYKDSGLFIDEREGVIGIGLNAFSKEICEIGVRLPSSIKYIADGAFEGCYFDCSRLPAALEYIGDNAFKDSYCFQNLFDVTEFPLGLKHIGKHAFANSSIEDVIIHKNVEEIGESAFANCSNMKSFSVDEDNPRYYSKDGILFDKMDDSILCDPHNRIEDNEVEDAKEDRIEYDQGKSTLIQAKEISGKINIPDGVEIIAFGAFSDNKSIEEVTLPESLKTVERYAFARCSNLKKVVFLSKEIELGNYAFSECGALSECKLPETCNVGIGTFEECRNLKGDNGFIITKDELHLYNGSEKNVRVPEGIKKIMPNVFSDAEKIETISIPDSVEYIGDNAIFHCKSLKKIIFEGVFNSINLGGAGIKSCSSLKELSIPNGATWLGRDFCKDCRKLEHVIIPASVVSIDRSAFMGCKSLSKIEIYGEKDRFSKSSIFCPFPKSAEVTYIED